MFFIDKYDKRDKAEARIVDLIANLRYYYDHWQRAKIFGWNLELVYIPTDSNLLKFRMKEHEAS